jgi:translation initiation factor IF-2
MAKKRIFEVAKELGVKTSEILDILAKNNIQKSNLNVADDSVMSVVNKHFHKTTPAAKVKPEAKPQANNPRVAIPPVSKPATAKPVPPVSKPAPAVRPAVKVENPAPQKFVKPAPTQPAAAGQTSTTAKPAPAVQKPYVKPAQTFVPRQDNRSAGTDNRNQGHQNQRPYGNNNYQGHTNNNNHYQGQQKRQGGVFVGPHGQRPGQTGYNSGSYQRSGSQSGSNSGNYQRSGGYQGNNGYSGNRPQGTGYQGQGGNRFQNNRSGGYQGQGGNRFQNNRSGGYQGQGGNRFQGGRPGGNRPGGFRKPASNSKDPFKNIEIPRGKESREKYNKKHEHETIKGSYATRDSRPNRNTNHLGRNNKHMRGREDRHEQQQPVAEIIRPTSVKIAESINVKEFAKLIKREVSEVIKSLFLLGVMVTINQDIDFDTAVLVGTEFNVEVLPLPPEEDPTEIPEVEDDPELRVFRPPVVTVMGHVDHGKTSLLDAIRKTNVTSHEAGGITQHIGAYTVNLQGKKIVFLDTPGHEAFTAMRARGAQCTDIAVLVVAADDGVMPQTLEAIHHARAAKVPIIVAINKIDKPGANPEHVKEQLAEQELIPEDWGGDTIMVQVSARQKTGLKDLLEMILLVAEVQDLKANPNLPAHGTIIEAQLDKGRGPVATALIQKGTLKIGDYIIAGTTYGRVRALINDRGEKVRKALPSTPVEVLGLNDVPMAGDMLDATDERTARTVSEKRVAKIRNEEVHKVGKVSLDDIFKRIQEGELKELNIVVKADVQGTIEALRSSLENIKNDEVKVVIVHSGVGAINESDVTLASAANALIIGFNVRPDANARKLSESEKVDVRTYRVIYDAINDVEAAIKGMLAPTFKEVVLGRVEVRQVITISKMLIAGCYVTEGKVTRSAKIRVVRDGIVIAEDDMESLRRFKDDVREVTSGFECGITLAKFHDIKEGDVFEAYVMEQVKPE